MVVLAHALYFGICRAKTVAGSAEFCADLFDYPAYRLVMFRTNRENGD